MKRIAVLLVIALVSGIALFAQDAAAVNKDVNQYGEKLIDFNDLVADVTIHADSKTPDENQATITDFSGAAGTSFSDAEKAQMKTSLAISNWEVLLNSSAKSVETLRYSYTTATKVRDTAKQYKGQTVLGVRVNFPPEQVNAFALITPPFEIPAYADKEGNNEAKGNGKKFDNIGVIKNVGILKSVSMSVFGNNTPHGISLILKDQNNRDQEYFLGYMNFDGWRTLTWDNPNYIQDVRDRDLHTYPLYPQSKPFVKVNGFRVYRDASMADSADFIGYIKDVRVVYDKAVIDVDARDIDDEGTWHILTDREAARRNAELQRLGQRQVKRYLESVKMKNAFVPDAAAPAAPAAGN